MDESQVNAHFGTGKENPPPNLGQLREHLMNTDFSQLQKGLDTYYNGLKKKVKLTGVALVATIASLPDFKGNVTKAQAALAKFDWPKEKSERRQIVMRVISANEQAQFEYQSVAAFKYEGVAAMDELSGPRIGSGHLGEQSFAVKYREQVTKCNEAFLEGDGLAKTAEELKTIEAALQLPQVSTEPKWDPNADCDGMKAEERVKHLGKEIEKQDDKKLSSEA
jgi:hypothetical protein